MEATRAGTLGGEIDYTLGAVRREGNAGTPGRWPGGFTTFMMRFRRQAAVARVWDTAGRANVR